MQYPHWLSHAPDMFRDSKDAVNDGRNIHAGAETACVAHTHAIPTPVVFHSFGSARTSWKGKMI